MITNITTPFGRNPFFLVKIFFRNDDSSGMERMEYVTVSPRYPHSYNKSDKSSPIDDRYWDQEANVGTRHKPTDNEVVHRTDHRVIAIRRATWDCRVYQSQVGGLRDDDKRDAGDVMTCG